MARITSESLVHHQAATSRLWPWRLSTQSRMAILFLLPWTIGFLVFTLWPMIDSLALSFTKYDILHPPRFIGFANYGHMFVGGSLFWQSLRATVIYVAGAVPLGTVIALLLAVLLNQRVWGEGLFRTLFYVPSVITGVATAILWEWIFQPQFGMLNSMLYSLFHIQGPQWIYGIHTAMLSLIIISFWSIGGAMLIYLAGLQGIQHDLYEAAKVDGATALALFRRITLPMLTPQILFNVVLGLIGSFQVFIPTYIITNGGPGHATTTLVLYLYEAAFEEFRMGYASALAWVIFLIIVAFTALIFRGFAQRVFYGSE
ncbi:MAG: sugar ABC transporter permease [Chloroflexi bacterium]|nr:sugar ABC transporter permease [Chloroflexota bacterium]